MLQVQGRARLVRQPLALSLGQGSTCPGVSMNIPGDGRVGSVGRPASLSFLPPGTSKVVEILRRGRWANVRFTSVTAASLSFASFLLSKWGILRNAPGPLPAKGDVVERHGEACAV